MAFHILLWKYGVHLTSLECNMVVAIKMSSSCNSFSIRFYPPREKPAHKKDVCTQHILQHFIVFDSDKTKSNLTISIQE